MNMRTFLPAQTVNPAKTWASFLPHDMKGRRNNPQKESSIKHHHHTKKREGGGSGVAIILCAVCGKGEGR